MLSEVRDFAAILRAAGVTISPPDIELSIEAVLLLRPRTHSDWYWALRLPLCRRKEDIAVFDAAFADWVAGRDGGDARADRVAVPDNRHVPGGRPDAAGVTGLPFADTLAGLGARDTRDLPRAERRQINALIALLEPRTPYGRPGRLRRGEGRPIDIARTTRGMLRNDEELVRLFHRVSRRKPRPMLLLLDVSGSMNDYTDAFLHFAHAAVRVRPETTEVFALGTRWRRLTPQLRLRDPQAAVDAAGRLEADWGGGTQLGATLADFLRVWAGRSAVRGATAVLASDGWDFGPPERLVAQIVRLRRLAHRLIWVNPRAAVPGYQPFAPGLQQSLRHADHVMTGHSLDALRELAALLAGNP